MHPIGQGTDGFRWAPHTDTHGHTSLARATVHSARGEDYSVTSGVQPRPRAADIDARSPALVHHRRRRPSSVPLGPSHDLRRMSNKRAE